MQAARLVTAEQAQAEYERDHKKQKQRPDGALYYNPKALYKVYKKRTDNVPYTLARPGCCWFDSLQLDLLLTG